MPVGVVLLANLEQRVGLAAYLRPPALKVVVQGAAANQPQAVAFTDVFDANGNVSHIFATNYTNFSNISFATKLSEIINLIINLIINQRVMSPSSCPSLFNQPFCYQL